MPDHETSADKTMGQGDLLEESMRREMAKFEQWVTAQTETISSSIAAVKALIEEHDFTTFSDFFLDCVADFKTHIVMKAIPNYFNNTGAAIRGHKIVDEWYHDLHNQGVSDKHIRAVIYDRGVAKTLEVMNNLVLPATSLTV